MRLETEGKESAVETARQLLAQRETEFAATERLVNSGNLPRLQLDNSRSALASARSQLEAAEAELARIEVRAPFSGVIDRVRTEIGSSVSQGSEIATLLSLDPIVAVGEVSERDVGYVRPGQPASSGWSTAARSMARSALSAATPPPDEHFPGRGGHPQSRRQIPAGMTAEITLSAEPVQSVMLPRSVITLSADGDLGMRGVDSPETVVFYPIDLVDDTPRASIWPAFPSRSHHRCRAGTRHRGRNASMPCPPTRTRSVAWWANSPPGRHALEEGFP
jgi:membrane fusion protein, multidrug efflux system